MIFGCTASAVPIPDSTTSENQFVKETINHQIGGAELYVVYDKKNQVRCWIAQGHMTNISCLRDSR